MSGTFLCAEETNVEFADGSHYVLTGPYLIGPEGDQYKVWQEEEGTRATRKIDERGSYADVFGIRLQGGAYTIRESSGKIERGETSTISQHDFLLYTTTWEYKSSLDDVSHVTTTGGYTPYFETSTPEFSRTYDAETYSDSYTTGPYDSEAHYRSKLKHTTEDGLTQGHRYSRDWRVDHTGAVTEINPTVDEDIYQNTTTPQTPPPAASNTPAATKPLVIPVSDAAPPKPERLSNPTRKYDFMREFNHEIGLHQQNAEAAKDVRPVLEETAALIADTNPVTGPWMTNLRVGAGYDPVREHQPTGGERVFEGAAVVGGVAVAAFADDLSRFFNRILGHADDGGNVVGPVANVDNATGAVKGAAPRKAGTPSKIPHGNSLDFVGDTHVYRIKAPDGSTYKIGESMQGVRVGDGASIRAEQQVRQLNRTIGPGHTSEIRRTFPDKAAAREYETNLIDRFRRMFGDDTLPGNLTNR